MGHDMKSWSGASIVRNVIPLLSFFFFFALFSSPSPEIFTWARINGEMIQACWVKKDLVYGSSTNTIKAAFMSSDTNTRSGVFEAIIFPNGIRFR